MDHWKGCWVGQAHWNFWFVQCSIEPNLVANEGIFISHHSFQSENHRISYVKSFGFHNRKDDSWNVEPIGKKYHQITNQANQGEG